MIMNHTKQKVPSVSLFGSILYRQNSSPQTIQDVPTTQPYGTKSHSSVVTPYQLKLLSKRQSK
jgi:hypothetical protein